MKRLHSTITVIAIITVAFILPVLLAHLRAEPPRERRIHIDLFRYGSLPEIIHVNRGDTLVLTFSARDTPHSFMLQEYGIDVKVSPNTDEVEVVHPLDPEAPAEVVREVVLEVGRPGIAGLLFTKSRFRCHVYCGEMHAFEQGFLVERPNYLYAGSMGILAAIPLIGLVGLRRRGNPQPEAEAPEQVVNLFRRWPRLRRLVAVQGLQFWLMSGMSILLYLVLLTSLVGTKMAGGNLGVLLLWVLWLVALVVIFVPLGGRIWCTVCPLPMLGDALQRGATVGVRSGQTNGYHNRFFGLMRRWPARLASTVPRTLSFLACGTLSVLIISQPRWTGWALVILVVAATAMSLIFELRAFCRYLCPINSFISLYARMGRLGLRARHRALCERCEGESKETCREGHELGWACPYGLTVSHLDSNAECGMCMECLRSCSFQNVALIWRPFRLESLLRGRDQALQAIVMLTLAVVYCLVFQGPWHSLRDMVDIVDKGNWNLFAVYALALWLVTLGLMPLLMRLLTALGARLAGSPAPASELYPQNTSPLVPMGLFIWIAFALPMLMVQGSFILSTLSDPFGWGWNLFGTAGFPWVQVWPQAIPLIQASIVLVGFCFALKTALRVWVSLGVSSRKALLGSLPMGGFLFALTASLIWFYTA